jgi:HAMP domain-containing protein
MPEQPETDATGPRPPPVKLSTPRRFAALLVALALVALGLVLIRALWRLHLPYVNTVVGLGLGCLCLIVAMLAAWRVMSAFLYKVGRRLSFSYFLIGVLPIPMVLLLLAVVAYLLACFFIGHVYRDALASLDAEVAAATRERAAHYLVSGKVPDPRVAGGVMPGMVFAYYRDGERIAGDPRAPAHWPAWASQPAGAGTATAAPATAAPATAAPAAAAAAGATAAPGSASAGAGTGTGGTGTGAGTATGAGAGSAGTGAGTATGAGAGSAGTGAGSPGTASPGAGLASLPRFYSGALGCPTLAAAAGGASRGVLGVYTGDLDFELSRRSDLWVETNRPGDPVDVMRIRLGNHELPLLNLRRSRNLGEAQHFFKQRSHGDWFLDHQLLWWGQASGPLLDLAGSRVLTGSLLVNLSGTPRIVRQHLFAANGEIDAPSWAVLVGLAVLLFNVYAAAALMALFMIVGLSRAVNRLSRATDAVRRGDFSARIPGGRRDQIGDLQRTFNEMAANLEMLVAASAQKELLEKELSLARDLQNSLIPSNLPSGEGVEFATLFEPSAAIGGDYFDVLRLSEREIAVIIADVSGHGLSTGLRMAMLKAALLILIEETRKPEEILRRLDAVVRSNAEGRCFVTATLAMFDLREGRLTLTNAGHPPTYIVRGGRVQEILLPSSPLGALGHTYARRELTLDRGDVVVWLSDGVFEETNAAGEPFGYDRIETALAAAARQPGAAGAAGGTSATGARRRTLAAAGAGGGAGAAAHQAEPSAAAVRDRLLAAVAAHVGTQAPTDDRTVVVMRWGGPLTVALEATAEAAAVPA